MNAESDIAWIRDKAFNTNTTNSRFLYCPIIQSVPTGDTDWIEGVIRVLDQHETKSVACWLQCTDPDSLTSYVSAYEYSSPGSSSTPQALSLNYVTCDDEWSASITCDIPDKDGGLYSGVTGYILHYVDY